MRGQEEIGFCMVNQGGESSWYDTPWRLVRGGIGMIFSELQLVLWVLTALILCILE